MVFLFYHGYGHLTAVFKIARILVDANYDVFFAGHGYFKQYILSQGFSFYLLKSHPFGYGFEKWSNTIRQSKSVYLSTLRDRITDRLYKERQVDIYWMLEELKPTLVLLDSRQATDFILLYPHLKHRKFGIAVIQAMLPMDIAVGHPPINTHVNPNHPDEVKNAINALKWRKTKKRLSERIIYLGFDNEYIICRSLKKNVIKAQYVSNALSLLNFSTKNIPEFILTPREFDFPQFIPAPYQHFIGFMAHDRRTEVVDPNYANAAAAIFTMRTAKKKQLIYCSFGTINPTEKDVLTSFLQKLIHIATAEKYLLIISLKASPEQFEKLNIGQEVFVFHSVPQLQVLQQTDLFITHGGINSIKEAVNAEVPMLLYPVHRDFDPLGNAARIEYHGLGLQGNILLDSEREIKEKISTIIGDQKYKRNVQALKKKDEAYTAEKFLKLVECLQ